ncbi:MAG: hypothetical protein C0409_02640 [Novosphingobium sp.]|nr:hypothetical protein [Novosphingobium sp.]
MTDETDLPRCPRAPIYAAFHSAAPGVLADDQRWAELNLLLDGFGVDRAARGLPPFDREDAPIVDYGDARTAIFAAVALVAVPDRMDGEALDGLIRTFGIEG